VDRNQRGLVGAGDTSDYRVGDGSDEGTSSSSSSGMAKGAMTTAFLIPHTAVGVVRTLLTMQQPMVCMLHLMKLERAAAATSSAVNMS
jgi:hypothetical protein